MNDLIVPSVMISRIEFDRKSGSGCEFNKRFRGSGGRSHWREIRGRGSKIYAVKLRLNLIPYRKVKAKVSLIDVFVYSTNCTAKIYIADTRPFKFELQQDRRKV